MQFSRIFGQHDIKKCLIDMVSLNRLSHAILFTGREGSGGLPLAIAFAQYIMCEKVNEKEPLGPSLFGETEVSPTILNDACGQCGSCRKVEALVHPDLHFSYPVVSRKTGDKPVSNDYINEWREFVTEFPYGNVYDWLQYIGAENRQGNITAEECNEIIHKLSLKSFESEYKILIQWMPEYLGKEGNKLLKLIEEPPAKTVFILVAEHESQMLPTILSRTQLVRIPMLSRDDISRALVEKGNLSDEKALQIASASNGNYREAILLVQHAGEDWLTLVREWLNSIYKNARVSQVHWIEEMSKQGREKQKQFLKYFNHLLEQAIRLQVMPDTQLLPDSEKEFAIRLNKMAGLEQLQAIVEELDTATYHIERNAHPKLLFHALTIKLYHIISDKSVILTS